jgi:hypothetical protein
MALQSGSSAQGENRPAAFGRGREDAGPEGLGNLVLSRAVAIFPCTLPGHACPAAV